MRYSFLPRTPRAALLTLAVGAGLLLAGRVSVRAADGEVPLYGGEPLVTSGISLGSWGTGTVEENADVKHGSERSLKIVTRDFYQGARLDLPKDRQVDLIPILRQTNPYLAVTVLINQMPRPIAVSVPTVSATGGMGGGYRGGAGGSGGGSGSGMAGGEGGPGAMGGTATVVIPKITKVRLVLIGQRRSVEVFSVGDLKPDAEGWCNVGIPLDTLAARLQDPTFRVERVIICGNSADTMYVSKVALVNDNVDISIKAEPAQFNEIRAGAPVKMTATAEAGLTPLKVAWDFDDRDGVQEETVGTDIKHTFAKPGRYTVTATAMPADSAKKKPVSTTFEVEVVP